MATIIVDQGTPILVSATAGVFMFVKCCAIKVGEGVLIIGKVPRHPVQYHADVVLVTLVDQVTQIIRAPVTAGRGIIAGGLVTPGFIQRVLGNRQQLNVGEPGFQNIGNKLLCQLPIGQPAAGAMMAPGAGMYLVDADWTMLPVEPTAMILPVAIAPWVATTLCDHRRSRGPKLECLAIGIGFDHLAAGGSDGELVQGPGANSRHKQ